MAPLSSMLDSNESVSSELNRIKWREIKSHKQLAWSLPEGLL